MWRQLKGLFRKSKILQNKKDIEEFTPIYEYSPDVYQYFLSLFKDDKKKEAMKQEILMWIGVAVTVIVVSSLGAVLVFVLKFDIIAYSELEPMYYMSDEVILTVAFMPF